MKDAIPRRRQQAPSRIIPEAEQRDEHNYDVDVDAYVRPTLAQEQVRITFLNCCCGTKQSVLCVGAAEDAVLRDTPTNYSFDFLRINFLSNMPVNLLF